MEDVKETVVTEETVTEEEIRSLIDLGEENGILEKKEHEFWKQRDLKKAKKKARKVSLLCQ